MDLNVWIALIDWGKNNAILNNPARHNIPRIPLMNEGELKKTQAECPRPHDR
jgi:hypothetical protein